MKTIFKTRLLVVALLLFLVPELAFAGAILCSFDRPGTGNDPVVSPSTGVCPRGWDLVEGQLLSASINANGTIGDQDNRSGGATWIISVDGIIGTGVYDLEIRPKTFITSKPRCQVTVRQDSSVEASAKIRRVSKTLVSVQTFQEGTGRDLPFHIWCDESP